MAVVQFAQVHLVNNNSRMLAIAIIHNAELQSLGTELLHYYSYSVWAYSTYKSIARSVWNVNSTVFVQTEVNSLTEATSKKDDVIFTPYLLPDANSLCSGLHLVKKLLKTEKFIFVIAKSGTVIPLG